jgi:hypothetical protein
MSEQLAFDAKEGERQKELGKRKAALSRREMLVVARSEAVRFAEKYGSVIADDVFGVLEKVYGIYPEDLGNAAGSIFERGKWEMLDRIKSKRVSNHSRWIFVWRLKR